jgi:elongation factor G
VPDEYLGSVTGDLNGRRGTIVEMVQRGDTRIITAEAPLKEMFGYATALRGMTQGRAGYAMEPCDYRPVPQSVAEELLAGV